MKIIDATIWPSAIKIGRTGLDLANSVFKNMRVAFEPEGRVRRIKVRIAASNNLDELFVWQSNCDNCGKVFEKVGKFHTTFYYANYGTRFWPIALCETGLVKIFGHVPKFLAVEYLS